MDACFRRHDGYRIIPDSSGVKHGMTTAGVGLKMECISKLATSNLFRTVMPPERGMTSMVYSLYTEDCSTWSRRLLGRSTTYVRVGVLSRSRQLLLRCSRSLFRARLYRLHPCNRTYAHPWPSTSSSCRQEWR